MIEGGIFLVLTRHIVLFDMNLNKLQELPRISQHIMDMNIFDPIPASPNYIALSRMRDETHCDFGKDFGEKQPSHVLQIGPGTHDGSNTWIVKCTVKLDENKLSVEYDEDMKEAMYIRGATVD